MKNKLVEEYSENIDRNKTIYNANLNGYERVCNSCTVYIVLLVIVFSIINGVRSVFFNFHWYLKIGNTYIDTSINTETSVNYSYKWKLQKNKYKRSKSLLF